MSTGSAGFWRGWQQLTPSQLLLALIMFPFPWIEVQCQTREPDGGRIISDQSVTVSALRMATKGWEATSEQGLGDATILRSAIFLTSLGVALLAGTVVGFWLPLGRGRLWWVAACILIAAVLLGAQTVWGYPGPEAIGGDVTLKPGMEGSQPVERVFITRYTVFYYVTVAAVAGALVILVIEWCQLGRARGERDDRS